MTDELLLIFGCVVTFVAVAGAYIAMRTSFERFSSPPIERGRDDVLVAADATAGPAR